MSDVHFGSIRNFYHYKKENIYNLFCKYIKPLLKNIDRIVLIQ